MVLLCFSGILPSLLVFLVTVGCSPCGQLGQGAQAGSVGIPASAAALRWRDPRWAHNNVGTILTALGRFQESVDEHQAALAIGVKFKIPENDLAKTHENLLAAQSRLSKPS